MRFYGAPMPAPNPRRVRIFAAEKSISLPEIPLDLRERDHKSADHLKRNSLGQVPVLELDDGTTITETVSICRYLDAVYQDPPMFGRTPVEIGVIDMWIRRIEIQLAEPTRMFWRHAHPATATLVEQHVVFGESNRLTLSRAMDWFDREISDGRSFITGNTYTMPDIAALTMIDFATLIGLDPIAGRKSVAAWHERVSSRPSATA
ncbi:glutathione S-transferase family protein [Sphingomonas sp. So64.6b]|uniref:glutathione S-transferase family protein n=1 Tax=Sphingomonas sp. So64.6b TaxID=2997354 RepID=UPI0016023A83|nr:glutathione S-transferase family protein [Sphingomonas sp. So64.6b]QNA85664.1 glutathione S-transferase family protein [Sphingomonas sp. So64.6b]